MLSASLIRTSVTWVRGPPHSLQRDLILIYILVTSTNTLFSVRWHAQVPRVMTSAHLWRDTIPLVTSVFSGADSTRPAAVLWLSHQYPGHRCPRWWLQVRPGLLPHVGALADVKVMGGTCGTASSEGTALLPASVNKKVGVGCDTLGSLRLSRGSFTQ